MIPEFWDELPKIIHQIDEEALDRVIDHRLVVDGDELLAHRRGDRREPRPGTAREDDSLHALLIRP